MPKNNSIQSILVIGSGPIVIGQAAEFDYAGTQACAALKEEGYKVILVNNNPATIMSDEKFADRIYAEPLTALSLTKIIEKERPDGLLATLGGQTGLNLAFQLHEQGVLTKFNVKLLGTSIDSIKRGEDREAFRATMKKLNEPVPDSEVVTDIAAAIKFAEEIGFPIIVRPAYTLGGTGGGIADSMEVLKPLVAGGLKESTIGQCLVEKSIAGYKEIEYEVMRDSGNTCITICNMENIDPVGIHTGDSIVVAPSQTLTDEEYQMLRTASIKIISELGIIGGCNIQFALDPNSQSYYLIEVNPRVSRSSALASKATGYPIARMAAKLAVGYQLSELINPVTGDTFASFEPALDYCIVKFPKWAFDKFPYVDRKLGTQMKATGEVMGIDRNFERALQKAVHSLELDCIGLSLPELQQCKTSLLLQYLEEQNDQRFFIMMELLRRGMKLEELHQATNMDTFFLAAFERLVKIEGQIKGTSAETVTEKDLAFFKEKGFSDTFLASAWNKKEADIRLLRKELGVLPVYKMVDTCAAEFEAQSNYFYSSYYGENEQTFSDKPKVLIIGSGPIRIGQGIEFDYCSVQGVYALKDAGIETIMINNNPETVSTDYTTADRLYFEPLILEDVLNVIEAEQIEQVIVQLGGQTALNLAEQLEDYGVTLLGTSSKEIAKLEDRELFYQLLDELQIPHIDGDLVHSKQELDTAVDKIGFPVLLRPSYVIGGKGMELIRDGVSYKNYLHSKRIVYPVLVDRFLEAKEAELDLAADGVHIHVPAIMEHIEHTGVHSGDSMSMLPPQTLSLAVQEKMLTYAKQIVQKLNYKGLMNIQYIIDGEQVYLLEVNPRASRTVPIVSKVTGVPIVQIATKILLGKYDMEQDQFPAHQFPFVCVKYPVFSNYALKGLDSFVGPEMKSTGEGIALASDITEALRKAFESSLKPGFEKVIISADVSVIQEFADECSSYGVKMVPANAFDWSHDKAIALYNPFEGNHAAAERELAVKNRLISFSKKESLEAFLQALKNTEWEVTSMNEWLLRSGLKVSEGVNVS